MGLKVAQNTSHRRKDCGAFVFWATPGSAAHIGDMRTEAGTALCGSRGQAPLSACGTASGFSAAEFGAVLLIKMKPCQNWWGSDARLRSGPSRPFGPCRRLRGPTTAVSDLDPAASRGHHRLPAVAGRWDMVGPGLLHWHLHGLVPLAEPQTCQRMLSGGVYGAGREDRM